MVGVDGVFVYTLERSIGTFQIVKAKRGSSQVPESNNLPGPAKSKRPTIRDVASVAGVSKSLVSLVIRGKPGVSPASRGAVLKAVGQLLLELRRPVLQAVFLKFIDDRPEPGFPVKVCHGHSVVWLAFMASMETKLKH